MAFLKETPAELESLAHEVIGAALEVHRSLGPGYLEPVYEKALCIELLQRGIPFQSQVVLPIQYKGQRVGNYRIDVLVKEQLVLELKAVEQVAPIHYAQLLSYLRHSDFRLGLLINFNVERLREGIKRVIL